MKTKRCKICGKIKPLDEFYVNKGMADGHLNICKECVRERSRQYQQEHKSYRKTYMKQWGQKNKDRIYAYRNKIQDKVREWRRKYYHTHITDIGFKILYNLRGRIYLAIKHGYKVASTKDLVGCSIKELKAHLESKFKDGMSWDNYGVRGWHIDHIIPCAAFDLTKPEEQKKCFHYTNLQPLWAEENLKKGAKII